MRTEAEQLRARAAEFDREAATEDDSAARIRMDVLTADLEDDDAKLDAIFDDWLKRNTVPA
jgi:hypothetical protein